MPAIKRPWPGPATAPYKNGNLLDYVKRNAVMRQETATDRYALPDEWRDNRPFQATLTLVTLTRGRSAAGFQWCDTATMAYYPMFLTDACDLMMSDDGVAKGTATGWWCVVKRGMNYGIARLRRDQEPK